MRLTRRHFGAGIAATAAASLAGCNSPKYTTRYRLTLEVTTPDGVRRGSSVFEQRTWFVDGSMPYFRSVRRGEAAWIDLPGGKNLLALLIQAYRGGDGRFSLGDVAYPVTNLFARHWGVPANRTEDRLAFLKRLSGTSAGAFIELTPDELPLLVTLKDPKAPVLTVIDPHDVAAGLGQDVKITGARLEITDDPLVWSLDARLPWLGQHSPYAPDETPLTFERGPHVADWGGTLWIYDTILQSKDW